MKPQKKRHPKKKPFPPVHWSGKGEPSCVRGTTPAAVAAVGRCCVFLVQLLVFAKELSVEKDQWFTTKRCWSQEDSMTLRAFAETPVESSSLAVNIQKEQKLLSFYRNLTSSIAEMNLRPQWPITPVAVHPSHSNAMGSSWLQCFTLHESRTTQCYNVRNSTERRYKVPLSARSSQEGGGFIKTLQTSFTHPRWVCVMSPPQYPSEHPMLAFEMDYQQ